MNKAELINAIAEQGGLSKIQVARVLDALAKSTTSALCAGDKVALPGLGHLEPVSRKARQGRNPRTGATIQIPASRTVVFRPGKDLKDFVNADA